ncbi:hypothetical protein FDH82_gp42 [Roseobacter phage RDJL Phi 2]|uniref:Uncharacterized protein n=1 Tax=Roseobacter phage RDJL Phi 2 TaxID=1682380 RepID=A0A0K0PVH6_9CAUD|nr:hypothetical protein FDH82_gp42 [Roseobacter phage RDJL Phi 2]AKQ75832.1 hypothetical protein RDJLphi2_gp42 [Roseobacter phage RDJL Phi 2]
MASNIDPVPGRLMVETSTTTTSKHEAKLSGAAIRRLLALPNDAHIKVTVPGGGDWSGMDLDLDSGTTLDISWETVK